MRLARLIERVRRAGQRSDLACVDEAHQLGERLRDHAALRYEAAIHRADADRIEAEWVLSVEGKNAEQRAAALSLALRGDDAWVAANTERGLAELRAALADAAAKEALQALEICKLEIQYDSKTGVLA